MLIALDCETTGLTWDDSAFLMSYAHQAGSGTRDLISSTFSANMLCVAFQDYYIFHNAKFDLRMLIKAGVIRREDIKYDSFHDTQILAQLLNENRSLKLKDLAKSVLGKDTDEAEVVRAWRRKLKLKKTDGYDKLPREVVIPYAIKDAEFTFELFNVLHPTLPESCKALYDRERQLVLDVLDMESYGLGVDLEYSEQMYKRYNSRVLIKLNQITRLVGVEDFNPGSTQQLGLAFENRGVTLPLTAKKNYKTDEATLRDVDDALARLVLEYRSDSKLLNTYLKGILDEGYSGILHPNFNVGGTKTGRFSSSKARE